MRASDILRILWRKSCTKIDARRLMALALAVDAVVRAAQVTLTALGRALATATTPKHSIKRIDRLLANYRVQHELPLLQRAVAHRLIRRERHPVVLVDWAQLHGDWWVLCAALPYLGRSLPIYIEVYPHSHVGNRRIHARFLERLAAIVPSGARPIIVADGGFRTPFFHACDQCKFDFVVRLRGRGTLYRYRESWISFADAFARAGTAACSLGEYEPFRSGAFHIERRIVLGPRPSATAGRAYESRRAAEPWLLATSLRDRSPSQIIAIYAMRMQVEETFRDAKNPRFGWALSYSRSDSAGRLLVLVSLACFALIAAVLAGAAAERLGLHRRLQANTTHHRRVLSLHAVGAWFLQSPSPLLHARLAINRIGCIHDLLVMVQRRRPRQLRLPFDHIFFSRR